MRGRHWIAGFAWALVTLEGCSRTVGCEGSCATSDAATDVLLTLDTAPDVPVTVDVPMALDAPVLPDVPSVRDVPMAFDVPAPSDVRMADAGPTPTGCHMEPVGAPGSCLESAQIQVFTRREFRVTQIEITTPAALASPVVGGIFNPAISAGALLIGVAIAPSRTELRAGALNINAITRGTLGRGLIDGLFDFYMSDAPAVAGDASAWNPVSFALTETAGGFSTDSAATPLVLPIFTPNSADPSRVDLLTVLRLSTPRLHDIHITSDGRCIGGARFSGGRFNECASNQWCTRLDCTSSGAPSGVIEGVLRVSDAQAIRLETLPGMPTLCTFVAGSDCSMGAPTSWMRPPDAMTSDGPGWRFAANFAAVSARIGP